MSARQSTRPDALGAGVTDRPRPAAAPTAAAGRPRFLLVDEVAAELRTDEWAVRRLIRRGELAALRHGRRYLVAPADLDAYLAALPRAATG